MHESRTAVLSSTTAVTLRQSATFVIDKLVEEDRRMLLTNEPESMPLPDGTTQALGRDAFSIFEDLRVHSSYNSRTSTRPVCPQLPSNHSYVPSIPRSYPDYNTTSSPCSSNALRALRIPAYPPRYPCCLLAQVILRSHPNTTH